MKYKEIEKEGIEKIIYPTEIKDKEFFYRQYGIVKYKGGQERLLPLLDCFDLHMHLKTGREVTEELPQEVELKLYTYSDEMRKSKVYYEPYFFHFRKASNDILKNFKKLSTLKGGKDIHQFKEGIYYIEDYIQVYWGIDKWCYSLDPIIFNQIVLRPGKYKITATDEKKGYYFLEKLEKMELSNYGA